MFAQIFEICKLCVPDPLPCIPSSHKLVGMIVNYGYNEMPGSKPQVVQPESEFEFQVSQPSLQRRNDCLGLACWGTNGLTWLLYPLPWVPHTWLLQLLLNAQRHWRGQSLPEGPAALPLGFLRTGACLT